MKEKCKKCIELQKEVLALSSAIRNIEKYLKETTTGSYHQQSMCALEYFLQGTSLQNQRINLRG